jgi:DNA-binding NarL/FixJ family response regulator
MRRQRFSPVVLVGKSILLTEGLARILRAANFRILASVSSAVDLRPSKPTPRSPLFLIVQTGDDFEAVLEQIELFRSMHPNGRIAIVADRYGLKELSSAFRAGANGYFANGITCERFTKSIELVMMGETIFPPAFLSLVLDPNGSQLVEAAANDQTGEPILDSAAPLLSPREKLILRCIIEGDPNKCIARKINIAEATVKVHVKAILRKIRVQNRTQAAIWGINNESHARLESGNCPLSISNGSFANHVKTISEVKQLRPLAPPHIEAASIQPEPQGQRDFRHAKTCQTSVTRRRQPSREVSS